MDLVENHVFVMDSFPTTSYVKKVMPSFGCLPIKKDKRIGMKRDLARLMKFDQIICLFIHLFIHLFVHSHSMNAQLYSPP